MTRKNIIYKHSKMKDHPTVVLNDRLRVSDYMEPCPGSRMPYSLIPPQTTTEKS